MRAGSSLMLLVLAAATAPLAAASAEAPGLEDSIRQLKTATAALAAGAGPMDGVDAPARIWRVAGALTEFRDGPSAPEMVVVPAGEFTMGSRDVEPGRKANEGPRHRVRIAYPFAVSKYAVTVGQFAAFVAASGHRIAGGSCYFYKDAHYQNANACSWRTPNFPQKDDSPVIAVSWTDATAYVQWLSKTTGHAYRLLSEAEFEYADRAGSSTAYWWGDDPKAACAHANGADQTTLTDPQFTDWNVNACKDGYVYTAPVAAFGPNPFGLYGMTGNAFTWTDDCWNETYAHTPVDGSAATGGACGQHVVRGGAWAETPAVLRSAARNWNYLEVQPVTDGLRVVRVL
jgi:formylglycine-generating enzyme required for sulfatase activity